MNLRTRLTATALLAATAFGLALAPGAPSGAEETPLPGGKDTSKTFSFGGFAGTTPFNTETFSAPGQKPIVGQLAGSAASDILWYTPGAGGDELWTNDGDLEFAHSAATISGTYTPKVGTFAAPDGYQDVLFYSTNGASQLWDFNANGSISKTSLPAVTGPGQLIIGDFALDGVDDVIRYRPGTASDSWWDFQNAGQVARPFSVNGTYTPVVGSLADDSSDDIVWYAPGTAADSLWDFNGGGARTEWKLSINGTYTPVVGSFSPGGAEDDIIWYKPGTGADSFWDFDGSGYTQEALTVNGTYSPLACDCFTGMHEDVLWYGAGNKADAAWRVVGDDLTYTSVGASVPGVSIAGHGSFDDSGQQILIVRH